MHAMYGWDWLLMSFAMGVWVVVLGVAAYVAVRSAARPIDTSGP